MPEQRGIRAGAGERDADAGRALDDAGGDLDQPQAEGRCSRLGPTASLETQLLAKTHRKIVHAPTKPQRFGVHNNAFGFLRLLFASLVIVSHVPEIVDNSPRRELLHSLTGGMTFGGLAVYGFFLISGFLVSGSYLNSRDDRSYMIKRSTRIYPAFVAASLVCLLIVAPLSGASFAAYSPTHIIKAFLRIAILARPTVEGAFPGQHYSDAHTALDGAMWTIQYEFCCYLIVIGLGMTGLLRRPALLGVIVVACFTISAFVPTHYLQVFSHDNFLPGEPSALFNLIGVFVAGAIFYNYRDRVHFHLLVVMLAIVGLAVGGIYPPIIALTYAIFGGYLVFAIAKRGGDTVLALINNKTDISYGVYLYGWPAEQLAIRYLGSSSLATLMIVTWAAALALGWVSWILIERPALMALKRYNQVR